MDQLFFSCFFHITWRWWKCHHLLAIQVYSPRACLWERHVYCAVLSTSMECNIYHGCHSQVEMLIQNISSLGYSTFCLIPDSFQALKEPNTFIFLQLFKTSWFIFEQLEIDWSFFILLRHCVSQVAKRNLQYIPFPAYPRYTMIQMTAIYLLDA